MKHLAAKVALKLSPGIDGVLSKMLFIDDRELSTIATEELSKIQSPQSADLAKQLIFSEDENLRLKGLALLVQLVEKNNLEEILNEYLNQRTYYYNVVTWLDRYLFAPGRYGEFFQKQLVSTLPAHPIN
jgi:hypothetical protein